MASRRPHISLKVQRDAAIIQLGLDPAFAELDHDPALALRKCNADGSYIPDANDPHYLRWRSAAAHKEKTFGRRQDAERTITTAGSDIHAIAKSKRLRAAQQKHLERIQAKDKGIDPILPSRRSKWPPKGSRKIAARSQR